MTVGGLLAGSLNVVWGQAGFTVLVLVLFNLVDPIGWEIGIIRVEDVALGAAVGVLIGLAAWPRGATGQLAQSLADAVEASGASWRRRWSAVCVRSARAAVPPALARAPRRCAPTACSPFPHRATQEFRGRRDLGAGVDVRSHPLVQAEMLARQSVARPPHGAGLVEALVERVHGLDADHAAVAAAIARREPPPPVRAPISVELLDPSRRLVANPPVDDPWRRSVIDILQGARCSPRSRSR